MTSVTISKIIVATLMMIGTNFLFAKIKNTDYDAAVERSVFQGILCAFIVIITYI
jgi:hypothetical protein